MAGKLSRKQVIKALKECVIETEEQNDGELGISTQPFIVFDGCRYMLCRTDLVDDVGTSMCEDYTAEEWRKFYLLIANECMGARLNVGKNPTFSIISEFSDG